MIHAVGGYWRPMNGIARLLEEIGEVAEQLDSTDSDDEALVDELADVFIISTCVANQFKVGLTGFNSPPITSTYSKDRNTSGNPLLSILQHAGRLARIVNHYDGPKNPRSFDGWVTIGPVVSDLHRELFRVALTCSADLDQAIERKIAEATVRDAGRFSRTYDPGTAKALELFEGEVVASTPCFFAQGASLWGAPNWSVARSLAGNVDELSRYLYSFSKAARQELLDGFVVAIPSHIVGRSLQRLAQWFSGFLRMLTNTDPHGRQSLADDVARPGWQFSYNGLRLFVSTFSPIYPVDHPRRSVETTFVVFQPEHSFDAHGIGSMYPESAMQKEKVRDRFAEAGFSYPSELIDQRLEAALYVLPARPADPIVQWWSSDSGQYSLFAIHDETTGSQPGSDASQLSLHKGGQEAPSSK